MTAMDKYFVIEPGAEPKGPYPLPEIADLLAAGSVSPRAVLKKVGDAAAPPRPAVIDVQPLAPLAKPMGPPPGVTPPLPRVTQPSAVANAPTPPRTAPPSVVASAPSSATSSTSIDQVDHTAPHEQLDEGWEGETEIHGDAPAYVATSGPVMAPPAPAPAAPVTSAAPASAAPSPSPATVAAAPTPTIASRYVPAHTAAPTAPTFVAPPPGYVPAPPGYVPPPPGYVPPPPGYAPPANQPQPPQSAQPHRRPARGTQPPAAEHVASTALAIVEQPRRPHVEPRVEPAPAPLAQQPQQPLVKPADDPPPVRDPRKRVWLGVGIGAAALAIGGVAFAVLAGGSDKPHVKDALVRVSTPSNTGTGFLIDGPDEYVYVATANHLVDRGERVLIERDVNVTSKKHYVEAYPETEIVATNPEADLAIIRVKNVEARRFARLPLAKEPLKDAKIFSYGYPGSSLAKKAGLVSKDGKVLSLVRFPSYDDRYARIVRENAVEGLLVSTDIEPGFSGGPTTNEAGEVVGVNVTKDRAHVGQNGAVSVVALRELLAKVKPANKQTEPTPEQIVAQLKKVQSQYLLLPLEERSRVRETEFLSASDLPALRRFVNEIRREERNTDNGFSAKLRLSGQAALGMYFARLPGNMLETYRAPSTRNAISACAIANQRLASFLGELETSVGKRRANQPMVDTCDELGVRPLAWDLAAATLQWDGKEKDYTVSKIDRMDDDGRVYRASVRISGAANLIELWFGIEQGEPRLKLFDTTENLYAIDSPRTVPASALQGTWGMKRPRVTDAIDKEAEVESEEKVSISVEEGGKVSILYTSTQKYFAMGRRNAFACNRKGSMEVGLNQSFIGTLENGVVMGLPQKVATPIGADADWCSNRRLADQIIAVKLVGDQLYLYRTDGISYPESIQLTKQ